VQNQARVLHPVPYDFDYSGLVDARYAVAARALRLKTVRERLYRGPCRSLEDLQPFLTAFRAKQADVMALVDSIPGMDSASRRDAKGYLEEFYSTINDSGTVKRQLVQSCSGRVGM
jgi:hypothetical protein